MKARIWTMAALAAGGMLGMGAAHAPDAAAEAGLRDERLP